MSKLRSASLACALFSAARWCAADAAEISEREFLDSFPTVLSASRLRQNAAETAQAITVIDQQMIEASGAREIAELFRLVPGFTVSYATHVKGFQPIVTYHGLAREYFSRLQVLIDGRSMNNATLGGVDWNDFPIALDDIERIEVLRGPSNATHGIGAFLAAINFVTKHASQQRGVAATVTAGTDGIIDGALRFGDGRVGGFDYRISAGHRADDGFAGVNDQRRRDYATARSDWQIDSTDSLLLQAGATTGTEGVGTRSPVDPGRTARTETQYAQARWERNRDADNGLSVQFYYYRFALTDRYVTDRLPAFNDEQFLFDEGSSVRRADVEVQQTGARGTSLRWVWGASLRADRVEVPLQVSTPPHLRTQRLFAHAEWRPVVAVTVNAGVKLEHNNLTGTDVAPQFAINYALAAGHVIRLGFSRALRTPTPIENAVQRVVVGPGGPSSLEVRDLVPETIVSREIGYVGDWTRWHATVDLKLFYDTVHDLIDLVDDRQAFPPTAFPSSAQNADEARQYGVEGQVTWRPFPRTLLIASAARVETHSADHFDTYSTSAPRNAVHLLASQRLAGDWDASASVHYQDAYRASVSSDPQPAWCRVDARIARVFAGPGARYEVAGVVENLFDRHYTEFRRDDIARRRVWLTMSVHL
jgi:iron complex outermembrane receptor protein